MTHLTGAQAGYQRTSLSANEKARGEANFAPYVAQTLAAGRQFRVSADSQEMVELFQAVARRVGEMLSRPVASYANGREIVIAFAAGDLPRVSSRLSMAEQRVDLQSRTEMFRGRQVEVVTGRVLLHALDGDGRPLCGRDQAQLAPSGQVPAQPSLPRRCFSGDVAGNP